VVVIGETGNVGQANYATAKSGMHGLTKTLALELPARASRETAIAPRFHFYDMMASVPEDPRENSSARIPVGSPSGIPPRWPTR